MDIENKQNPANPGLPGKWPLKRCVCTGGNMSVLCVVAVSSVTQLHDVVYVVCYWSSTIWRFNATTHDRLADIDVKGLRHPHIIAACEQTSQIYVADRMERVWQMSADGEDIKILLPKIKPWSLSVTSTRLLVALQDTKQLLQFDADGNELRRVQLPDYMDPRHAVESAAETFILSHSNTQLNQYQVSEVDAVGNVLHQLSGSGIPSLVLPPRVAVESHGNIFLTDAHNCTISLLDAQLTLRRVIIDEDQLNHKQPRRVCYIEPTGQLLVGMEDSVAVFGVLCQ